MTVKPMSTLSAEVVRLSLTGVGTAGIAAEMERSEEQIRTILRRARNAGILPKVDRPKLRILSDDERNAILDDWFLTALSINDIARKYAVPSIGSVRRVIEHGRRDEDHRAVLPEERAALQCSTVSAEPAAPPPERLADILCIRIGRCIEVLSGEGTHINRITLSAGLNLERAIGSL